SCETLPFRQVKVTDGMGNGRILFYRNGLYLGYKATDNGQNISNLIISGDNGTPARITDENGHTTVLNWSVQGDLTDRTENATGDSTTSRTTHYVYDTFHNVTAVFDPRSPSTCWTGGATDGCDVMRTQYDDPHFVTLPTDVKVMQGAIVLSEVQYTYTA